MLGTTINIRRMTRGDLEDVLAIEHAVFFQAALSWKELKRMHTDPEHDNYIAESKGLVLGYVLFKSDTVSQEIVRMAVAPTFHRQGIGRALLEIPAPAPGPADISMESRAHGEYGAFLRALGFTRVNDYPGGQSLYRRGWRFKRAPDLQYRGLSC